MKVYLTPAEAAEYLGVKDLHSFLYRRRKAGWPVKTYRLNGRLRFRREDLDAAMTVERGRSLRKVG